MESHAKLMHLDGERWIEHRYEDVWRRETVQGTERLVAAPSRASVSLLSDLVAVLAPPAFLLWVLHTPRTKCLPGRYQSPPLSLPEIRDLLLRYAPLFEMDARSDIWVHALEPEATVVLERHGLIYAYGLLPQFEGVLQKSGLHPGRESVPSPHAHNYHAAFDAAEAGFAAALEWRVTALRAGDEQVPAAG